MPARTLGQWRAGPSLAAVAPRRFDVGGCWSREGWFWWWRGVGASRGPPPT